MDTRDWMVPLVFLFGMAGAVSGQAASDLTEGFEKNDFSKYPWMHAATQTGTLQGRRGIPGSTALSPVR